MPRTPMDEQSSVEEFRDRGTTLTPVRMVDGICWRPWNQASSGSAEAQVAARLDREKILWLSGFLLPPFHAVGSCFAQRKAGARRKSDSPLAPRLRPAPRRHLPAVGQSLVLAGS